MSAWLRMRYPALESCQLLRSHLARAAHHDE
jgi:hypothetical protein